MHPNDADSMAVSELSFRNALVGSLHAVLLFTNGLRKRSSQLFPSLGEWLSAECCNYCKVVNGWVWFES